MAANRLLAVISSVTVQSVVVLSVLSLLDPLASRQEWVMPCVLF